MFLLGCFCLLYEGFLLFLKRSVFLLFGCQQGLLIGFFLLQFCDLLFPEQGFFLRLRYIFLGVLDAGIGYGYYLLYFEELPL